MTRENMPMHPLSTMKEYADTASWAVWQTDQNGALTGAPEFPAGDVTAVIHGRAMIVGLNPGGSHSAAPVSGPPWRMFHASNGRHNDIFLAHAFLGTPLWGAYMTDLHPEIIQSKSELVRPEAGQIELSVRSLITQANLLGAVEKLVCVGGQTASSVLRHADLIERETGIRSDAIVRITHYSRQARGKHRNDPALYRSIVHGELGI